MYAAGGLGVGFNNKLEKFSLKQQNTNKLYIKQN